MAKIKRSQVKHFVNTTPTSTAATYKLLGTGVTTGQPNMNPKTTEETYINADTATISVDSYAPSMQVEMTPDANEDVWAFIDNIRTNRKVLSDAETDIVEVDYWKSSNTSGYPARKQNVAIQIDNDLGGDGGTPAKITFTFNYQGDPVSGRYNVSSGIFTSG